MRMFAALAMGAFLLLPATALGQTFEGRVSNVPAIVRVATGMPPRVLSDEQRLGLQLAIANNRALIVALRSKGLGPSHVVAMELDGEVITVWVE